MVVARRWRQHGTQCGRRRHGRRELAQRPRRIRLRTQISACVPTVRLEMRSRTRSVSIQMIRAHAKEWGIDPAKVGIMGFSAGGETSRVGPRSSFHPAQPGGNRPRIEQQSDRPDFAVLVYPPVGRQMDLSTVPTNAASLPSLTSRRRRRRLPRAPDRGSSTTLFFNAKIPVELHIYGQWADTVAALRPSQRNSIRHLAVPLRGVVYGSRFS